MKYLLNTLFVTSEDIYLSLDGENVVANRDKQEVARYPLHTLSGIVSFSYSGASPALMGACTQRDVSLAFCTPRGRFLARVTGEISGNVLYPQWMEGGMELCLSTLDALLTNIPVYRLDNRADEEGVRLLAEELDRIAPPLSDCP